MPFSPQTLEEKPYNLCLNCAHIGKRCDGPNFLAMDTERWCEWCRLRKEYLGWTNARIADGAGVSKISVDRVMSGNVKDLRISTMQSITRVLVNGTWGQYPCAMAGVSEPEVIYVDNPSLVEKVNEANLECKRLQAALDKLSEDRKTDVATAHAEEHLRIDYLKEQIKFKEEQMRIKDKLLEERYDFLKRKDRIILCLSLLLALALLLIIAALVVDRLDPGKGFFWLTAMFGEAKNTTITQLTEWGLR